MTLHPARGCNAEGIKVIVSGIYGIREGPV